MRKVLPLLLLVVGLFFSSGCSSLTAEGQQNLGRQQRVFVEERLNDNLGISRAIAAELRALGYDADHGPLTMAPDDTQLIVTYDAREAWDGRQYLIELNIAARPATSYHRIIAAARYFRPGITNKSSGEMVHEAVQKLFPPFGR